MRPIARAVAVVALSLTGAIACAETGRFSTKAGESYCGNVVAASFVRAGVPEDAKMRLQLDADALQKTPGRIWTSQLTPVVSGGDPGDQLTGDDLAAIPQLANDPLSTLSFGEGRVKNAIAVAKSGPRQMLVVLSLLQSGEVEVRLIRGTSPGSLASASTDPPQIFGVFRLSKEKGDCGLP
jgi:hypothetical protein